MVPAAVAINGRDGWLHAGDAYYYYSKLAPEPGPVPPFLTSLRSTVETDPALRLSNVERLRAMARNHATEVTIVSAHDPWEFLRQDNPRAARPGPS